MNSSIEIDGRMIGEDFPPYVIAELSANHNGDIERAYAIMEAAKNAGADAIKLQTYSPDTITLDSDSEDFQIKNGLWAGKTLYQLYDEAHMPWEWHEKLFKKATEIGITIFSSPFDSSAVELLEGLGTPAYKIASFEVVDLPLIRRVAKTGKPLIISTGMANKTEIAEAVNEARSNGCKELVVLHCVSGYPAPADQYNLRTVPDLADSFEVITGLSDHTINNATSIAAVALGACVIEKHITLDRNGGGADDSFSILPAELKNLCNDVRVAWSAKGIASYERSEVEKENVKFRRSLYFIEDVQEGSVVSENSIRSVRPGYGLPPKLFDTLIGKTLVKSALKNTPVTKDYFNEEI